MGFEIAEQLGWRFPDHVVSPVAGGTLLPRIYKGMRELREVGLVSGRLPKIHAAQPSGSAPVVRAIEAGQEFPDPVKPNTIAKSLAIGNPADGFQVVRVVKETGASAAMVSDEEILDAVQLLARTEGIFTEAAGGTTLAATRVLVKRGVIAGRVGRRLHYGQRLQDCGGHVRPVARPTQIGRSLADFDRAIGSRIGEAAAARV